MVALIVITIVVPYVRSAFAASPVVTDVRVSQRASKTRVVFEFTRDLDFKVFILANPHRVVVDLSLIHI